MRSPIKCISILCLLASCLTQYACFKKSFNTVDLPNDYNLQDTTGRPQDTSVVKKVLLIGIDGCRADALLSADAPNITGLLQKAVYSFDAQTNQPTLGGPGWSSMLTGVWSEKHGVMNNTFQGKQFDKYPTLYKYISELSPSKLTTSIVSWNPINQEIATYAKQKVSLSENDKGVKDSAIDLLKFGDPDLLFLQFDKVDEAGHQFGFSPDIPEYMTAIHQVDNLVGKVLEALKTRATYNSEQWLIIVSTDHGGIGASHGGSSDKEKNIFTIFNNNNFASREIVPPPSVLKAAELTNGGNGSYASLSNYYNLDSFSKLSFQFEIKSAKLDNNAPFLTNKNWQSGKNPGFIYFVSSQSWGINIGDGTNRVDIKASSVPNLNDNFWHTLTVTLNRNGDATLYQDGIKCGSSSMAYLTTITTNDILKLVINRDIVQNYRSNFSIANIKIWSDVLSAEYIAAAHCDTTLSNSDNYKSKLLSWWKCNDGDGNIFRDSEAGGYNFQLIGNPLWSVQSIDFCNNILPPSVPTTVDIMPTIMEWLGYNVDYAGWHLDGRSWLPLK